MKSFTYFLLLSLAALVFSSCQKDLDVPLPEHTKRLVVNAFLTPGKTIDVYLSRSYGPLEDIEKLDLNVRGATVELYQEGQLQGRLLAQDTTIYLQDWNAGDSTAKQLLKYTSSDIEVEGGKRYELKVSHPDYESITASTIIPENPEILSVEIEQNAARSTDEGGYTTHQSLLTVEFKDIAGMQDQYRIRVAIEYESPWEPGVFLNETLWEFGTGAVTGQDNTGAYTTDGPWLSDGDKDGQTIQGQFLVTLPNAFDQSPQPEPLNIREVYVELFRANSDTYEYLRKLKQQEDNESNGFEFFPPEAIVVTSNVQNGYGIFGGLGIGEITFAP